MCAVEHTCNLSTLEAEAGGSEVQDHPWACALAQGVKASAAKPDALVPGAHMVEGEH